MVNRKYNRVFVLLSGKNTAQSLNGSCDMEVINGKGRLYAYIGKLNKLTYTPRKLYLISVGLAGSLAVSAGMLVTKGRNVSLEAEFDPDDMFGSGMTFEEINAVAVWSDTEGPENSVIEGFVSKHLDWKNNLQIFGERIRPREVKKPKIEESTRIAERPRVEKKPEIPSPVMNESQIEEKKAVGIRIDSKELKTDNGVLEDTNIEAAEAFQQTLEIPLISPHDTFRAIAQKFRKELDMLDEMGIIDKTIILGDEKKEDTMVAKKEEKPIVEKKEEPLTAEISYDTEQEDMPSRDFVVKETIIEAPKKQVKSLQDMLFDIKEHLVTDDGIEWIKIDYREAYFIDDAMSDIRNRFVKNSARKRRHMIFGRDGRNVYIGVPGEESDKLLAHNNGFQDFMSVKNDSKAGYWIKAI